MELLMRAYEREISFSEKGKNQKDRDGGTIRSFHSSTSAILVVIGKMKIASGTMVEVVLKLEGDTDEHGSSTGKTRGSSSSSSSARDDLQRIERTLSYPGNEKTQAPEYETPAPRSYLPHPQHGLQSTVPGLVKLT